MAEIPFVTSETDLAAFLVLSGINLIGIQYEPRNSGKMRGLFVFTPDNKIDDLRELFKSDNLSMNFPKFKQIREDLLDRIMGELP